MADNLEDLLDEYSVEYYTTGQNTSKDFVNVTCDGIGQCVGDTKHKMGLHRSLKYGYCWSCHGVNIKQITDGLGIPLSEWLETMENVEDEWSNIQLNHKYKDIIPVEEVDEGIEIPGEDLHQLHKDYLIARGLDPEFLSKEFGVKGITYAMDYYKGTEFYKEDYKLQSRIIIPIYYNNVPISYLGRSYRTDIDNRYMCCLPELEFYFHKHMLYGIDKTTEKKVLLVEGVFDYFKLVQSSGNFNIVASFGTSVKPEQKQLLRKRFDEVVILFDNEPHAQESALEIKTYMESYGKKATNICLKGDNDPGDLDKETAKFLVEKLLGGLNEQK